MPLVPALALLVAPTAAGMDALPFPVATEPRLRMWVASEVRCDGAPVVPVMLRRAYNTLVWGQQQAAVARYRFRIGADGRPLSIKPVGAPSYAISDDLAPSLAASRFAAGARADCTVAYRADDVPLAEAGRDELVSYTMNPLSGRLPQAGWARIREAGATCDDRPRPGVLLRAYPDFERIAGTPGVRDWSMIGYETDARGRPIRPHLIAGTRNTALDAASVRAVARSRFGRSARTGCLYPYWRAPAVLAAPTPPDTVGFRPADATCPPRDDWATKPRLVYPQAFSRRSIEGWAIVAFDVAPWGQTGNVRVLASEPAAGFGEAAAETIRAATKAKSASGATGCVERVRYVIRPDRQPADSDAPVPPPF